MGIEKKSSGEDRFVMAQNGVVLALVGTQISDQEIDLGHRALFEKEITRAF
jgi:hypothetical protein